MSHLIQLESITKDYGSFRALDNVSIDIKAGVTGLLGPNGAGKSTLIKVLLGLVRLTSGSGLVFDVPLGRGNRRIREMVGYLPEDDCYFPSLTGIETVQLAARLSRMPAVEGLRRSHEVLDFCGIQQERYRQVETYSTGMRQKLKFAAAVVHDPSILILDEPTSGLDPEERTAMLSRIRLLAEKHDKAVVICTHILPDIQSVSDHVIILAHGRVKISQSIQELQRPTSASQKVRVFGDTQRFLQRANELQLAVTEDEKGILTVAAPDSNHDRLWQCAQDAEVGIQHLSPSKNSLEEIFLAAVREKSDVDS